MRNHANCQNGMGGCGRRQEKMVHDSCESHGSCRPMNCQEAPTRELLLQQKEFLAQRLAEVEEQLSHLPAEPTEQPAQ